MNFFVLLHNFMDKRFILTVDLNSVSLGFFFFFIKLRAFTFSLKGGTLWLLFSTSKLPGSLLLHFGPIIE